MNKSVKSTFVLVSICAVIAVMLALTNYITAPIIMKNENAAANDALLEVLPDGGDFEKLDISTFTLPSTVTDAYSAKNGGYVFKMTTTGYSSGFVIMCGINADGTVSGAVCLSSTETLGYEATYGKEFVGKNSESIETVDTISGATKTTAAYRLAVKDALNSAIIVGGGSVDIRTEEEILLDNLSLALPLAEGKFSKLFLTEVLEGVDAVYEADNGEGYVCIIGEDFIGVDSEGNVISDAFSDVAENVSLQIKKILESSSTEIVIADYAGLPSALLSASKTESGNYILDLKGAGYGINGGNDYHPASGEYIYIRVSMTKDGKIIDCLTVSEEETDGIGSVCADEKFYGQFVGKTEENYGDIDAISGATVTTNGYKNAILRAFESVKILEGGQDNE